MSTHKKHAAASGDNWLFDHDTNFVLSMQVVYPNGVPGPRQRRGGEGGGAHTEISVLSDQVANMHVLRRPRCVGLLLLFYTSGQTLRRNLHLREWSIWYCSCWLLIKQLLAYVFKMVTRHSAQA